MHLSYKRTSLKIHPSTKRNILELLLCSRVVLRWPRRVTHYRLPPQLTARECFVSRAGMAINAGELDLVLEI